ncbi:hypothetical protein [Phenylobacterium sp.]|uniref:tetratricopeptide repeat protein n=1 Tax=Phenylobacterium sp. TaxID=1871053 RepID=UPI00301C9C36
MAKKRSAGAVRAGVFAVVGLAGAAAIGAWILNDARQTGKDAEAAEAARPELPTGRLQVLNESFGGWTYLAIDEVRRDGDRITAPVLTVARTTTGVEGGAFRVARPTVDCAAGRVFDGPTGVFDANGKPVSAVAGYAPKHGRVAEPADYQVPALCQGRKGRIVADLKVAQREAQEAPETLAAAGPGDADPHAAAWLCAAAARGAWRPQAPEDCARAIRLAPADHALRIDRGYMFVKIGRNADARADFAKVLADEPENAPALYGISLLAALRGDEAASRRDRGAALDLDEDVPNWVARTYKIQMSQAYRVR